MDATLGRLDGAALEVESLLPVGNNDLAFAWEDLGTDLRSVVVDVANNVRPDIGAIRGRVASFGRDLEAVVGPDSTEAWTRFVGVFETSYRTAQNIASPTPRTQR